MVSNRVNSARVNAVSVYRVNSMDYQAHNVNSNRVNPKSEYRVNLVDIKAQKHNTIQAGNLRQIPELLRFDSHIQLGVGSLQDP